MPLKTLIQFPIFAPPPHPHHRPATEIRLSRWNNANADKFIRHERTQKDIEDQLRFLKRFNSALTISTNYNSTPTPTTETFKSTGTPSTPSTPSIPGKKSKYSKTPQNPKPPHHPAFQPILRYRKLPSTTTTTEPENPKASFKVSEKGVSYKFADAPFEYQYSYTESPKVRPIKLREPPIAPFGPTTMPRPWTGRKPLGPSKKKVEFDSFKLPPANKKGVKPVQAPGPFLHGSGPKYVRSREEVLGEALTKEEVKELVESCRKSARQLNMGRDGLTHNMLENIHAHWKRRRVCKIKCKGVCTVDLDNVREQLEEKTGGKVIYSKGGVMYLFRGRNYNYKTRPRYPLMLWKPITPVYPRLVQRVPEGLTLEEASEMRKKGRKLTPIYKLGKNGVYCDMVKDVREAFEACELVRLNCQGMNGSDYRKIGAKLKDLVPCVLVSFELEHILMWRGRDWKSSILTSEDDPKEMYKYMFDGPASIALASEGQAVSSSSLSNLSAVDASLDNLNSSSSPMGSEDACLEERNEFNKGEGEGILSEADGLPYAASNVRNISESESESKSKSPLSHGSWTSDDTETFTINRGSRETLNDSGSEDDDDTKAMSMVGEARLGNTDANQNKSEPLYVVSMTHDKLEDVSESAKNLSTLPILSSSEGLVQLWKQAVESGSAVVLDDSSLDADIVYERAVALTQSAPRSPVFTHRPKNKAVANKFEEQKSEDSKVKEVVTISVRRGGGERKSSTNKRRKDFKEDYMNVVSQGSLRVDELAKLLA